jgi:hypothetical protein
MPAFDAVELLSREQVTCSELIDCIASMSREHGHIEAMISIGYREKESGKQSLDYIQVLIKKLRNKLDELICTD